MHSGIEPASRTFGRHRHRLNWAMMKFAPADTARLHRDRLAPPERHLEQFLCHFMRTGFAHCQSVLVGHSNLLQLACDKSWLPVITATAPNVVAGRLDLQHQIRLQPPRLQCSGIDWRASQ